MGGKSTSAGYANNNETYNQKIVIAAHKHEKHSQEERYKYIYMNFGDKSTDDYSKIYFATSAVAISGGG